MIISTLVIRAGSFNSQVSSDDPLLQITKDFSAPDIIMYITTEDISNFITLCISQSPTYTINSMFQRGLILIFLFYLSWFLSTAV